jgi:uncharacterized cupin superfamily protein
MVVEARVEPVDSGLAPLTEGWFVVNVQDAAWLTNDSFGAKCVFEANRPVLRRRPDLETRTFPQIGVTLAVIWPGRPSALYHAESEQEDFLVLAGDCVLVIEGEERRLRAWDFVHCPPGTNHAFIGAGDGPCVIFMVGRRSAERTLFYPSSDLARRYGASVDTETSSPNEAYAPFQHWQPERPDRWDELPWAR